MGEMKIRMPKSPAQVEVRKVTQGNIEVTELRYEVDIRLNMELFHPNGKFSGAGVNFGATAIVIPGADLESAKDELLAMVDETHKMKLMEKVENILEIIKKS